MKKFIQWLAKIFNANIEKVTEIEKVVYELSTLDGDITIRGDVIVKGNIKVEGTLYVTGGVSCLKKGDVTI